MEKRDFPKKIRKSETLHVIRNFTVEYYKSTNMSPGKNNQPRLSETIAAAFVFVLVVGIIMGKKKRVGALRWNYSYTLERYACSRLDDRLETVYQCLTRDIPGENKRSLAIKLLLQVQSRFVWGVQQQLKGSHVPKIEWYFYHPRVAQIWPKLRSALTKVYDCSLPNALPLTTARMISIDVPSHPDCRIDKVDIYLIESPHAGECHEWSNNKLRLKNTYRFILRNYNPLNVSHEEKTVLETDDDALFSDWRISLCHADKMVRKCRGVYCSGVLAKQIIQHEKTPVHFASVLTRLRLQTTLLDVGYDCSYEKSSDLLTFCLYGSFDATPRPVDLYKKSK